MAIPTAVCALWKPRVGLTSPPPPPLHLRVGVRQTFKYTPWGLGRAAASAVSGLTGQSWLRAGFSASSLLHWPIDKKTYSKGCVSGVAVTSPTAMGKWRSSHHLPFSAWHLHISQLFRFATSFFFPAAPGAWWFWPSTVAFSLHFFQNHRWEQTTSRWSSWCADITVPLGLLRQQGGNPSCIGGYGPLKNAFSCLSRENWSYIHACNTPPSGMERSIHKVLQSIQRSVTPIWLPTCRTGFTAL